MLTILGGLAEFERELIRARTGEGRKRAVARGVKMGRPPKMTPHQIKEALRRRDAGEPMRDIARSYNVSHSHDFATAKRMPLRQAMHEHFLLPMMSLNPLDRPSLQTFSSRFSSFRKRQSVCSAMSLCGSDLIKPASCIRSA